VPTYERATLGVAEGCAGSLLSPTSSLAARRREPELMDEPALDRRLHEQALDALARVNRLSLTSARAWAEVRQLWRSGVRPVRVLDVACGGGDVLVDLARRAHRWGLEVELTGCDLSRVALERAERKGRKCRGLRFVSLDALAEPLPDGHDLVLCTLFLHHVSDESAVQLLSALGAASRRVLLVQDLRRSLAGYGLAWLGLHVLTASPVARRDGLVSVRASYTLEEARDLVREARLRGAEVRRCWPQRFFVRWVRA